MSEIEQDKTERVQEAPVSQLVLEKKFVRRSKNDTTPSVLNVEKIVFHNTGAVLVTRFDDVQPGQEITMLGDGQTTIQNNARIETASGANTLLTAGKVYRFTHLDGKLHEDAGSAGGGGGGATGARGPAVFMVQEAIQPREPMVVPGRPGNAGTAGAAGKNAQIIPAFEQAPPIEPMVIPGKAGVKGADGIIGRDGRGIPGLDGANAPEPVPIPGRKGDGFRWRGNYNVANTYIAGDVFRQPNGSLAIVNSIGDFDEFIPNVKGVSIPGIDGKDSPEPQVIPGRKGDIGLTGAAGRTIMIPGLDGKPAPEPMMIPGKAGNDGDGFTAAGEYDPTQTYFPTDVVGYQGTLWWTKFGHPPGDTPGITADWLEMLVIPKPRVSPPSMEVAPPREPMMIPGQRGVQGPAGGTFTFSTVELDFGAAPVVRRSGHAQITGLAGLTAGKAVLVQQAAGPYTGKGTRADEAEMDAIQVTGKVLSAAVIDLYWASKYKVRGKFKFDYAVSA